MHPTTCTVSGLKFDLFLLLGKELFCGLAAASTGHPCRLCPNCSHKPAACSTFDDRGQRLLSLLTSVEATSVTSTGSSPTAVYGTQMLSTTSAGTKPFSAQPVHSKKVAPSTTVLHLERKPQSPPATPAHISRVLLPQHPPTARPFTNLHCRPAPTMARTRTKVSPESLARRCSTGARLGASA